MPKLLLAFLIAFLFQLYCTLAACYGKAGTAPGDQGEVVAHFFSSALLGGFGIYVARRVAQENAFRQAASETIKEQQQRIDTVLAAAGISLWEHNLASGMVRSRHYGGPDPAPSREGANIELLETLIHPDDRERFSFTYRKEIEGDATSYDAHYQIQNEAGEYLDVINRGAILRDASGKAHEVLGATIDLTRQRKLWENQRQSLEVLEHVCRSRSEFLATMGHELRTPLNSILGFSELLEAQMFGSLNERQLKYTGNIVAGARSLETLINDVLMIAKGDPGDEEPVLTQVQVSTMLSEVHALFTIPLRRKQLTLAILCPEDLLAGLLDRAGLKRALYCLLDNAVKFSPEGGLINVSASILPPVDGKEQLQIEIQDFGPGIPVEAQQRIFMEFERLDGTLDRIQSGIGMGLPNARKIASRHGGTLTVKSSGVAGEGSLFSLRIPLANHVSNIPAAS